MRTKANIYPRVSDWREVEIKQYNWTNDYSLLDLEIVFYEADAEYSYGSSFEIFKNALFKSLYDFIDLIKMKDPDNVFLFECLKNECKDKFIIIASHNKKHFKYFDKVINL